MLLYGLLEFFNTVLDREIYLKLLETYGNKGYQIKF